MVSRLSYLPGSASWIAMDWVFSKGYEGRAESGSLYKNISSALNSCPRRGILTEATIFIDFSRSLRRCRHGVSGFCRLWGVYGDRGSEKAILCL